MSSIISDNKDNNSVRVFVALSLSGEVMDVLKTRSIELQQQLSDFNIRWVPFENYHITLIFIGNVPETDLDQLQLLIKEAVNGVKPFSVTLGDTTLFPPDNEKKGVMIASVENSDALADLQSRLDARFREAGFDLVVRPYRPHVTLSRLRRAKVTEEHLIKTGETFTTDVNQVHLYFTEKRDGRVYNGILRTVDL
ncbi:RNA 2',3'-cyclic phosphodiesterase [Pseudemcibacter aquimaris]|uniref:RNA 2',3'-cyclic phosphodiesterase n=1 Tax=Pseudemcibacter aquimaris TaxID=2857064 RepID=UPI0020124DB8|nr:RNA 2',3'-cyclic phosphodiesterase [Pseudemcibacter aquimaris]MCC3860951.1 RNA 2',3'-cyclic phosphodiesterase [Pseudemcibacter aquimaris]WDU59769.1 RNA 2',3'-cyclic phosphodiesterase [Pseudemcibacter aquimaris]